MHYRTTVQWSCAAVLVFFLLVPLGASGREWTDVSGKFRIEAEFVALRNDNVILEREDGSIITVSFARLSKGDQDFVLEETGMKRRPAAPPSELFSEGDSPSSREDSAEESSSDESSATQSSGSTGQRRVPLVRLKVVDSKRIGEVRRFPDLGWNVTSLAFSPSGGWLAVGKLDNILLLLDVNEESTLIRTDRLEKLGQITACAFTPDSKRLLTAGSSGTILVWSVSAEGMLKQAGQYLGHSREVTCLAVSADSKYAISGGEEKRVSYWEIASGDPIAIFDGFEGSIKACWIAENGRTAMATDGAKLQVIDLRKKEIIRQIPLNRGWASGQAAAISADGSLAAAGDGYKIRVWRIKTGREIGLFDTGEIQWSLAFTPDGSRLLSGGSGKLHVWDMRKMQRLDVLECGRLLYVKPIAASPDNLHAAAIPMSAGQTLQVFRLPDARK